MTKPKMPPTTRSKGKAPAAPAARVYESTPTPAQVEFPARRRTVKTYRKQPQNLLRQQTLTQIGYVGTPPPQELEDSPEKDERPQKRRKTMGDAPNSSFHTQTLTQLISELDKDDLDENMLLLSDQENEDATPQDGPHSEGSKARGKGKGKRKAPMPKKALSHSRAVSMVPQTPVKNKRDIYEIPSSQPTPDTPLDLPRHRIQEYRSPLKEREPNTANPHALPTASKRPRDMVIQDSYSSAGLLSSDPVQTPVKSSLSASSAASGNRTRESTLLGEITVGKIPYARTTPTQPVPMINNRRVLGELDPRTVSERVIPDSDDELDSLGPTPVKSVISISSSTPIRTRPPPAPTTPIIIAEDDDQAIGDSDDDLDPGSPTPVARRVHANPQPSQTELYASKHTHLDPDDEPAAVATPTPAPQSTSPGQSQPPQQSQLLQPRFQLYPGQDLGAAVLSEIKLPHGGSYPSFYTTKLGDFGRAGPRVIHTTETLVPSERPVQGSSRGGIPTAQPLLHSYSVPRPSPPGGPRNFMISGNKEQGFAFIPVSAPEANSGTTAPPSSSTTRIPAEVIEISDDSPVPSPRTKGQGKLPDSTQMTQSQPSQRSTRARHRATQESNTTVSTQGSSQDQVPDTPLPPHRVRIEVPHGLLDDERVEVTPGTSPQRSTPAKHQTQPTQARSQYYSQGLESQRVPLDIIRSLGPQTDRTDIALSIHPGPAELIAKGVKHYEFRNYKLPVSRIWLYITAPVSELRFMATIGPAKEPGEIPNEGVGNDEFNAGRGSKYAHELLQVYVLNNPVPLKMIKERGVFQTPPQKYQYLPPAIVGELLGNLRCALFDSQHPGLHPDDDEQDLQPGLHTSPEELPEPEPVLVREATASQQDVTVSQQIEEQLRSDIILATSQAQPALPREPAEDIVAQSSQSQYLPVAQTSPVEVRKADERFARPQIPASRLVKTPHRHVRFRDYNTIRPSQATTASEPSSPVLSPEKSVPIQRPFMASSGPSFPDFVGETQFSPLRATQQDSFDLASSQVPALPESLFVDDIQPPADVVWDSEEDDEDKI